MAFCGDSASLRAGGFAGLALCLCLTLPACSGSDDVEVGKVSGTVTLDGKPVSDATISFMSDSGVGASADLASDGSFTVTSQHGAGLPTGQYKVAVAPATSPEQDPLDPSGGKAAAPAVDIPAKYQNPATSGLTADVKAGGNDPLKFELSSN